MGEIRELYDLSALWGFPLRQCASADTASIPWEAVFPRSVREAWTL